MKTKRVLFVCLLLPFILSLVPFDLHHRALIIVDIDDTLGVQALKPPMGEHDGVVFLCEEGGENFYLFPGALDFMGHLLWLKKSLESHGQPADIALFTMGVGQRNEMIRDYLEMHFGLRSGTIKVFDYSNAVFAKDVIERWHLDDPTLSDSIKGYFDSFEKPVGHVAELEDGRLYFKDLNNILPYYPDASIDNAILIDDNEYALPKDQDGHLIVAKPKNGYDRMLADVSSFFESTNS